MNILKKTMFLSLLLWLPAAQPPGIGLAGSMNPQLFKHFPGVVVLGIELE
jgi:hypothetical protein